MIRKIIKFLKDTRGAAVIELGLVAPVIGLLVLVSFGVWDAASRRQDMRTGLDAASLYYMNGGVDDTIARNVALDAWSSKPAGADVTTSRACQCGSTPGSCSTLCTGDRQPGVYVLMQATGQTQGAMFAANIIEERTIRVR